MGIGTILKLTLALMTASLFVSVSTFGDIGNAISNGMGNIQDATDFTVKVDNGATLSNASQFVRDRAGNDGCAENGMVAQQNDDGGYPALSDEYMGKYPTCSGTSSTLVRGASGAVMEEGQDMEGIYSRVRFEVTETVIIHTSEEKDPEAEGTESVVDGNTWLENRLVGISKHSYQENTMSKSECESIGGGNQKYLGMGAHFVMYFQPDAASQDPYRADKFMQDFTNYLNDRAYCHPDGDNYNWGDATISELDQHPVISQTRGTTNKIVLCPGDRGYIQMNKGAPMQHAEAGESWWSGSAANFPHIQITNLGTKPGSTCAPAEMGPAATFWRVENAERIELPLEADEQIASMIPDKFENTVIDFVEGYWDEYASQTVDEIRDIGGDIADTVLSSAADALGTAVDAIGDVVSGIVSNIPVIGGDEPAKTIDNALDSENIDPLTDMVGSVFEVAQEAIDGTMDDSLHLELQFTNHHLDMDDDAFPGDPRGGFKINLWDSGNDTEVDGQFETEPMGGLYHEDVPQGELGAGELDALQSGWDGSGDIDDLGCYVKAELLLEQKEDSMDYPERAEQVWDIWIGDLGDGNSDMAGCSRDDRISDGGRGGVAWGGTSTLEDIEISVTGYDQSSQVLTAEATATAANVGDENLNGGTLSIGQEIGHSDMENPAFENCEGDNCTVEVNIDGISPDSTPIIKAEFKRNRETTDERHSVNMGNYVDGDVLLGEEHWEWSSEFNFTDSVFNVNVSYGYEEHQDQATNISGTSLSLSFVPEETETDTDVPPQYDQSSSNLIQTKTCEAGSSNYLTHCKLQAENLYPSGELEVNATIEAEDEYHSTLAEKYDIESFEVPFGDLEDSFSSVYNATEENFDLNVTYSSDITLSDTDLAVMNITNESDTTEIGNKDCGDSNSCKLELEDLKPGSSGDLEVNATLERAEATRHAVHTLTN